MKSRIELQNIALLTSSDVVGVMCVFDDRGANPKPYLYKCPKALAETLTKGDLVLADYDNPNQAARPVTAVIVREVLDDFDPAELTMVYRWIFDKVEMKKVQALKAWENEMVEGLVQSQRRRARQAMIEELGGIPGFDGGAGRKPLPDMQWNLNLQLSKIDAQDDVIEPFDGGKK